MAIVTADHDEPATALPVVRDYNALAVRIKAAAQQAGLSWSVFGHQTTLDGREQYELLMVRIPASSRRRSGRSGAFKVLLNGGTHGDEPAGAEALVQFLERGLYRQWPEVAFTITPCLNPWGYTHDRREGPGGRDLNRSFRRGGPATPEISLLKRALRHQRFDLFIDCHEDVDAPGLYVFAPPALGQAIVEAVRRYGPVHPGPLVDGELPVENGVVVRRRDRSDASERPRIWRTWPLPFYIARYHHYHRRASSGSEGANALKAGAAEIADALQATVETPTRLPLDQRVAMQHAAIDAALRFLHMRSPVEPVQNAG
jgi:hypothetical protein